MNTKLKSDYEKACNAYLQAFCEKHGYDYEDATRSWVGGDVGGWGVSPAAKLVRPITAAGSRGVHA